MLRGNPVATVNRPRFGIHQQKRGERRSRRETQFGTPQIVPLDSHLEIGVRRVPWPRLGERDKQNKLSGFGREGNFFGLGGNFLFDDGRFGFGRSRGHGLLVSKSGLPVFLQCCQVGFRGLKFVKSENLRAPRREIYGERMGTVGSKILRRDPGESGAVFRIVGIQQKLPLARLRKKHLPVFDRLVGKVCQDHDVVFRATGNIAAPDEKLVPFIGLCDSRFRSRERRARAVDVPAQADEVAVELEFPE